VLGQATEPFNVAPYQLGSAVVVVVDQVYPVRDRMVGLSEADVKREENVDQGEDEDMVLAPEKASDAEPGFLFVSCFRGARFGS
jgi:hypothetical protein